MNWMKKLNYWQRFGIIFSLLCAIVIALNSYNSQIASAHRSAEFGYNSCIQDKEDKHSSDTADCTIKRSEEFALYSENLGSGAIAVALSLFVFICLVETILFYSVKILIVGFKSVVSWKSLRIYQKFFVAFCVVFTTLIGMWELMTVMNMYVDTEIPVALSDRPRVIKSGDDVVLAQGTWVRTDLTDDSIMDPLQTSRITCIRPEGHCYQSTASVSGNVLMSDFDEFDISKWTPESVIYREVALCATTTYTIDLITETVSGAGSDNANQEKSYCKSAFTPNANKITHWNLLLTNGFKVYWEMRTKARPYLLRVIQSWFGN